MNLIRLRRIKRVIRLFPHVCKESLYWFWRDLLYSSSVLIEDEKSMLSWLMIKTHIIEKGLTMPERRLGFGTDRIQALIRKVNKTIELYGHESIEVQTAINDLEQYLLLHEQNQYTLSSDIINSINRLLKYKTIDTEKCYQENRDNYFKETNDFAEFSKQRRSVRWYSQDKIDEDTLKKCVELAQNAPSACNRQSLKVYFISDKEKKKTILDLQTGNRGFGDSADTIVLITSDQRYWTWRERTMAYLDAGIFTMNLLYAFHYHQICACPLNALMTIKKRKALRAVVNYSKTEIPMIFISIGRAPEQFMVPGSQRVKINQICQFV